MKSSRIFSLTVLGLALILVASGCKHKAVGVTEFPDRKYTVTPVGNKSGGESTEGTKPYTTDTTPTGNPTGIPTAVGDHPQPPGDWSNLVHDREALKAHVVHFDVDSATIKSSDADNIQAVADFMKKDDKKLLEIEGHCDERGTEGYNLSLGERRALAAREALIAAGVSGDRMKTVSRGESQPADPGHDEAAYKQNRRAEFVVVSP